MAKRNPTPTPSTAVAQGITYNKLNYSNNWNNKLFCPVHTTFRVYKPDWYYPGAMFTEYLKDAPLHNVQVTHVKPMYLREACSSIWLTKTDAGVNAEGFYKLIHNMYGNKYADVDEVLFCLILLQRIN